MKQRLDEIKQLLAALPRVSLAFLPTPLHRLDHLSQDLGINLYVKRDDFTGKSLFGGNKTRKLEFLIGQALHDRCEYVFTYGATQSNHAMQTAWAATSHGLKPVLYLTAVVAPDPQNMRSNLLLDRIFDAEMHVIDLLPDESFGAAQSRALLMGRAHQQCLVQAGHACVEIPMGGANAIGTAAYVHGFIELYEQADAMHVEIDHLYHSTGSGGTMAGLVAGQKLLGSNIDIQSIAALETDADHVAAKAELANAALRHIRAAISVEPADFTVRTEFCAPGYERPSVAGTEAIKLLAKREGLLLDPVYTAKAFAALLHDVRSGKIKPGSHVVFLHTGGATALFAENEILGDVAQTCTAG